MRCWTTSATSPRPEADPVGLRAGFTIIELLIVIGVVLVIGAISLPFTLRQFERRTETEAIDRLGLLIRLARAESRSTGVPLEVRCDASGRRITVLRVDPRDPPSLEIDGLDFEEDEDPERRLLDSWSNVELPESLTIVPAPEDGDEVRLLLDDLDFEGTAERVDEPFLEEDPWPAGTRLLLMVPDGTAIATEDFGLRSRNGWRRVRVDPWTAVLELEASPNPEAMESPDSTEEDPAVEDDVESDLDVEDDSEIPTEFDAGGLQ